MKLTQIFFLIEARRNPHLNPKIDSSERLINLYDNADDPSSLFVTFTDVNKLGINPSSEYNTPNGIYCYKLPYIIEKFRKGGIINRPFPMKQVENVKVFKLINGSHVFNMTDKITDDIRNNITKPSFGRNYPEISYYLSNADIMRDVWVGVYKYIKTEVISTDSGDEHEVESNSYSVRKDNGNVYSNQARTALAIFRKLGIDGFIDDGHGVIHPNEPCQAVFFNHSILKVVDDLKDQSYQHNHTGNYPMDTKEQVEYIITNVLNDHNLPNKMAKYYRQKVYKWIGTHIKEVYDDKGLLKVFQRYDTKVEDFNELVLGANKGLSVYQKDELCHILQSLLFTYQDSGIITNLKAQIQGEKKVNVI